MKKLFIKFSLGALVCLATLHSFGKGTITGKLIDAGTDESLIGATVTIQGTTMGVSTNLDGSFVLKAPAGDHVLVFSLIGYINQTKNVKVADDKTLELGTVKLESNVVGLAEVLITSSFAKDRQTPVTMSKIEPLMIEEKLGGQEFPEIMKTTPSVYVTKDGGGFGDATVRVRGFDTYNVGVLINGMPVNGMEDSKVYWSNWQGLSDVTSKIQVQRGLGAAKMGLSSVGGTINVLTRTTDAERGGSIYAGMGTGGMRKESFNVSTGLLDNGWAVTIMGTRTSGDGYVKGLSYEGYTYFGNISKQINEDHRVSFTIFGAPQTHNQRGNKHTIEQYRNHKDGIRFNSDYGLREGKTYGGAYGYNYYHKPVASINHYWNINEKTLLNTVIYGSTGTGGGRRVGGTKSSWLTVNYTTGEDNASIKRTAEGLLDFDAVAEENRKSLDGSLAFIGSSVNNHVWCGAISTLTTEWKGLNWTAGLDGRWYKGEHYSEVIDLLGGQFYMNSDDKNLPANTKLKEGDYYSFNNDGKVLWGGLFLQSEYVSDNLSGFVSGSLANKSYQRTDYFLYAPGSQVSDWINFLPWNVKAGVNYNINSRHNVYANAGYIKREPVFSNVFLNYTNAINEDVKYETVITAEVGYSYTSKRLFGKANAYYTNWLDKALVKSFGQAGSANIPGINALHYGVEAEVVYKPASKITIEGMFSWGDWTWTDDVSFTLYDEDKNVLGTYKGYFKGVHVGNSAQATAAISANYEVLPKLRIGADYTYYAKNFAQFDPTNRVKPEDAVDAWQLPNYGLIDLNMNYKFKIGTLDAKLYANVNNLLNTEYVADAADGTDHGPQKSVVYFGFGTTWSTGLKIYF